MSAAVAECREPPIDEPEVARTDRPGDGLPRRGQQVVEHAVRGSGAVGQRPANASRTDSLVARGATAGRPRWSVVRGRLGGALTAVLPATSS